MSEDFARSFNHPADRSQKGTFRFIGVNGPRSEVERPERSVMRRLVTAHRDIELRPDDVLLIETEHAVYREQAETIQAIVRNRLGVEALVLGAGLHLAAVVHEVGTPIYDALAALES